MLGTLHKNASRLPSGRSYRFTKLKGFVYVEVNDTAYARIAAKRMQQTLHLKSRVTLFNLHRKFFIFNFVM